jgi:hypothetical protein
MYKHAIDMSLIQNMPVDNHLFDEGFHAKLDKFLHRAPLNHLNASFEMRDKSPIGWRPFP